MAQNTYDSGVTIRLKVTITDTTGSVVDPGALVFKIRQPDGTTTTYTYVSDVQLVKASTGVYYVDWAVPKTAVAEGTWAYRYEATGANATAVEGTFRVRDSAFY